MASPFDSFANERRWVEWRNISRNQGQRTVLAKMPRGKDGKAAKADDPSTWLIRKEAEALLASYRPINGGGIGWQLGPFAPDIAIGGVDLDTCIVNGELAPWASIVIERFKSYCEISPSGTGIKIFFYYQPCPELTELLGDQYGRSFKRPTGHDHPPAIELFLNFRFFAVTEKPSHRAYRDITFVELADLQWLINEFGPQFAGDGETGQSTTKPRDNSRSARAFSKARALRGRYPNIGFERFCELLHADPDPDIQSWLADKGDDRQLRRAYDNNADVAPLPNWDDGIAKRTGQYLGHEWVREMTGRWFDEWHNELVPNDDPDEPFIIIPSAKPSWASQPQLVVHTLARWHTQPLAQREWFLEPWLPLGQTVGLYGTPGSQKSTLLLQWMIGACLNANFAGSPLGPGPCLGLFCEDSETEIARRAKPMLDYYGASFADMTDCHAESLLHATRTELVSFSRNLLVTTDVWDTLIAALDQFKPRLLCLDVIADFFGGNEINRREVSAFLRLLDQLAAERQLCIIYAAHPSLRGIATGSLTSGSTTWEGKNRARLTLHTPDDNPDNPIPNQSNRRTLTLAKANYTKPGLTFEMIFKNNVLVPYSPDDKPAFEIAAQSANATRCFNELFTTLSPRHPLSPNKSSPYYAPRLFAQNQHLAAPSQKLSERDLLIAMETLLSQKLYRVEQSGPPSRRLSILAKVS